MTTMIYKRTVQNSLDYEQGPSVTTILHDNWDSINAQIAEVLERMIPGNREHYDSYMVEEWNDWGDEWRVEQQYAKGAFMSELFNSEFVQAVKQMYGYPVQARLTITEPVFQSFPTEPEELAAEKKAMETYPSTFLHEFTDPDDDEVNEANQERAGKAIKMLFAMCDYLRNGARPQHSSWWSAMRHWKAYENSGAIKDTTNHFLFTGLGDPAFFNAENFDAHNITYQDYERAKNDAEWRAHLAYMKTPEGKAEEKARQQAEADLRTYMGEGGYTSYARNDNGTVTVWRD